MKDGMNIIPLETTLYLLLTPYHQQLQRGSFANFWGGATLAQLYTESWHFMW